MLNKFIEWAKLAAAEHADNSVKSEVTIANASSRPSARLDIDTVYAAARITCWEGGDYYSEIMARKNGEQIYSRHGALQIDCSLSQQFEPFFLRSKDRHPTDWPG